MTAITTTGCPNGCAASFLEGFGVTLRCRRCGWQPNTQLTTQPCPKCGAEIPLAAGTHLECGWLGTAGSYGPVGPSHRTSMPTREREQELQGVRAEFGRDVVALRAALVQVEQKLRDAKLDAQRIGVLEELQSGRAAASTRDALLAATRQAVTEAARRMESAAWSQ